MSSTETMAELTQAYNYFAEKISLYDNIDYCYERANYLNNKIAAQKPLIRNIGWGVFWFTLVFAFDFVSKPLFVSLRYIPVISKFLVLPLEIIALIVTTWLTYFLGKKINTHIINSKIGPLKEELEIVVSNHGSYLDELHIYLNQYQNKYGYKCPLEFEYTWPRTIAELKEYVRLGRADTLKEALNLHATDVHHSETQNAMHAAQVAAQLQHNETLRALNDLPKRIR